VKDSVKNNGNSEDDESSGSNASEGNFDTLKQAAQETAEEEQEGDDTPIEVLEEDGLSRESPKRKQQKRTQTEKKHQARQEPQRQENQVQRSSKRESASKEKHSEVSQDLSGIEDRLDRIIDQNARMIEILESFGN